MPWINYIPHSGDTRKGDVPSGDSVMEGAIQNSVDGIVAECGGNCQCATCHVYVDENWLSALDPIDPDQDAMLNATASPRESNSRLSCQIKVSAKLDGLIVRTPPTQT